jgi:hypothetical protein
MLLHLQVYPTPSFGAAPWTSEPNQYISEQLKPSITNPCTTTAPSTATPGAPFTGSASVLTESSQATPTSSSAVSWSVTCQYSLQWEQSQLGAIQGLACTPTRTSVFSITVHALPELSTEFKNPDGSDSTAVDEGTIDARVCVRVSQTHTKQITDFEVSLSVEGATPEALPANPLPSSNSVYGSNADKACPLDDADSDDWKACLVCYEVPASWTANGLSTVTATATARATDTATSQLSTTSATDDEITVSQR